MFGVLLLCYPWGRFYRRSFCFIGSSVSCVKSRVFSLTWGFCFINLRIIFFPCFCLTRKEEFVIRVVSIYLLRLDMDECPRGRQSFLNLSAALESVQHELGLDNSSIYDLFVSLESLWCLMHCKVSRPANPNLPKKTVNLHPQGREYCKLSQATNPDCLKNPKFTSSR
jgi:hypothetical protein